MEPFHQGNGKRILLANVIGFIDDGALDGDQVTYEFAR